MKKLKTLWRTLGLTCLITFISCLPAPVQADEAFLDHNNCPEMKGYRVICDFESRKNYVLKCPAWAHLVATSTELGFERFASVLSLEIRNSNMSRDEKNYKLIMVSDALTFAMERKFEDPTVAFTTALVECGLMQKTSTER